MSSTQCKDTKSYEHVNEQTTGRNILTENYHTQQENTDSIEDEEHFLLFCKKHDTLRTNLFTNLNLDLSTLQNDSETTSSTFNKLMNPKSISETK
jgi:hypothetical protein